MNISIIEKEKEKKKKRKKGLLKAGVQHPLLEPNEQNWF